MSTNGACLDHGFYWVRFVDDGEDEVTVGEYDKECTIYPWTVIGSDEIYSTEDIVVISKIKGN